MNTAGSLLVDRDLRFDARLALHHETAHWLAIADLHYGYELSQRAAGALFPAWGMQQIEERVASLIADYQPQTVLFLGDLIHSAAAVGAFTNWVLELEKNIPHLILIRGNHDRALKKLPLHDQWRIGTSVFHHGDRPILGEATDVLFGGHLHPTRSISDGAGFRQNLPALCRTPTGWILPAFSPWAAGGTPRQLKILEQWILNQTRIWKIA